MMPPKRTWSQSNEGPSPPRPKTSEAAVPTISRKVKACAACRKQKIRCIIDQRGPPCKRCTERNLPCVLNKSLQTLIDERSQWRNTWSADLEHVHGAVQDILSRLSLPPLPPLQSHGGGVAQSEASPHDAPDQDDPGPSCDNSPRPSPGDDALLQVPIESLYQITRLRALRSDDAPDASPPSPAPIHDFISQGIVSIEDADRLVNFYLQRIDTFMYLIGGGQYRDLETMRRGSTVLTAAVCTVAALHDPACNHLYAVCNREFRRLLAASMFERRINRDSLRAMCIGAYWLHDISWFLSGCAIRRATEVNLSDNYEPILKSRGEYGDKNEDAMESLRIWYILYICDHHLSILYGRQSIVREDASILAYEQLLKTSTITDSDRRMISQMALLIIMSDIRDLFGPDIREPVPKAFVSQLTGFSRRIDQWMGFWTTELAKLQRSIGEFPTKGVLLHHHFAKLHLHSHVFRGLKGAPVPTYFQESAAASVTASTAVIEMLLDDPDVRQGLVGIPHYIHSMIAFACVFLLKVAAQYTGQYIEDSIVLELTGKVVQQLRSTPVGKYHLVHLMADGLEKMAASKIKSPSATDHHPPVLNGIHQAGRDFANESSLHSFNNGDGGNMYTNGTMVTSFEEDFNLGLSQFLHLDTGTFGFNFEGLA